MADSLSLQLNQLLQTFANDSLEGGTASAGYQQLYRAVSSSPLLARQMDLAIAKGTLKKLSILEADSPRGAEYGGGTIHIKLQDLTDPRNFNFLIKTLGHETQHALFDEQSRQNGERFSEQVKALAASKELEHDYTQVLAEILGHRAEDEARAEIAGWNAVVSALRQENPDLTFQDVADKTEGFSVKFIASDRSTDPITYTLKPGLTLNSDLSMNDDSVNIQAMAEYYYYAAPENTRFGHHKDSDYNNDYATGYINQICISERMAQQNDPDREPPHLLLDMERLRLSERLLERNGLYLGSDEGQQCRYFTIQQPDQPRYFDNTYQTHEYYPNEPDGTRLPPPEEEPLPEPGLGYTTDESEMQSGPFERGAVLPRPDGALPDDTETDHAPESVLSPIVQRLKDDLDEQLKPKLLATGCCSEQHADAMVAEGVKRCVECGAESVMFAGIHAERNQLVLQTDQKNGSVVYNAIAASRVEPEQTLREADRLARGEQVQQTQQIQDQAIQLDAEFLEQQQQQAQQVQQQQQEFVQRLVREREERVMRMEEM